MWMFPYNQTMHFRSSLIIGVVLLGLSVVSCGEAPATNVNSAADTQLTGTVQQVGQGSDNLTPYLFAGDTPTTQKVFLQSTTVDLSGYTGQHVTLEGNWMNTDQTLLQVLSVAQNNDNSSSLAGSMKSFSSSKLGVFFNYPASWEVMEKDNGTIEVHDTATNKLIMSAFRVPAGKGETFDSWVARNYPGKDAVDYQMGLLLGKKISNDTQDILLVTDNSAFFSLTFMTEVQGMDTNMLQRGIADLQGSLRFFTPDNSNTNTETATDTGNTNTNAALPSSAESNAIVSYITANAASLVGDGNVISEIELAGSTHAYITYTEKDAKKKVLLEYKPSGSSFTTNQLATFDAGENTTWVKTSGSNIAASEAREVFALQGNTPVKTADVQKGNSLYTNNQLGFQLQYPRSWYFISQNITNEGGLQKVTFSDKPLDETPTTQVEIKVYPKAAVDLSSATKTSVGGMDGYLINDASGERYAVVGADGRVYVGAADVTNKQAVESILGTLSTK